MDKKFFILSYDHLTSSNTDLKVFDKIGFKALMTDFARLLGWYNVRAHGQYYGSWWTSSKSSYGCIKAIDRHGLGNPFVPYDRTIGVRPAIPLYAVNLDNLIIKTDNDGVDRVEYGRYPQTMVSYSLQCELDEALFNESSELHPTGNTFSTDYNSFVWNSGDKSFRLKEFEEFEYKGEYYVRFANDLNNGKKGATPWFKVEPVKWIIDFGAQVMFSENILFAGVRYNPDIYYDDFEDTEISNFLNGYFAEDLLRQPQEIVLEDQVIDDEKSSRKTNPYKFVFSDVSEEDIIRGAVESDISVFLHGRSSEGKSARVKQLDPDCEIIYMLTARPDSLIGKSVYNSETGEMIDIPPTWYKKLVEKCEAEPDKIHIVFFDELTNALPSLQGMALNIILDHEIEGKWKLPLNARIVAAGNEVEDSLAANRMIEPLFNRFAHVYIETTTDNWLEWASTPNEEYERIDYVEEPLPAKIHPAIYAYIAYKKYGGVDVLRTPYDGNRPNADPRKWEMASKVLYRTNNPKMLRALIGESLTADFVKFVRKQVITLEDVLEHNYYDRELVDMDVSEQFSTAVGLSSVDEEHFEIVREFMKKLSPEARATFESIWTRGDKKRLEILAEIQLAEKESLRFQGGGR